MNLAIVSIVIFILLSPAILARRLYFTRELSSEYALRNTLREIFGSIFVAIGLHTLWCILCYCIGKEVDIDFIIKLLFNGSPNSYDSLTENIGLVCLYFMSLYIAAGAGGFYLKKIVRKYGWDRKYELLEFDNKWVYLISGEILDIKKYRERSNVTGGSKSIHLRYTDILVKSDEEQLIYSGSIVGYQLNGEQIDYIILQDAIKIYISNIRDERNVIIATEEVEVEMPTKYLLIPHSNILNVNFRYGFVSKNQNDLISD